MKQALIGLGMLLLVSLAHAVSESDFAFGYSLEVDGDGAIYSLTLPEAIYHGLVRADRGDLRVFNSEGSTVPYHLMLAEKHTQKTEEDATLPLFPLYVDTRATESPDENEAHIVTNDSGKIIDINYGKLSAITTKRISAYLLDCSQLTNAPSALIVNWPDSQTGFVVNAELAGSDDLKHWQPIIVRQTLSDLQYDNHILVQRRIDLPLHRFKYLRLSWLDNRTLKLESVDAQFPATYQSQDRQWSSFKVTDSDHRSHTYTFDTHSVLPVDRVNIDLPGPNTLVRVSLASSASGKQPWHARYQGLMYNLSVNGDKLHTPAKVVDLTSDRYWKLRVIDDKAIMHGSPVLRLGWIPEKLYFIARGQAPFTLAYGSARVGSDDTSLAQLRKMDKAQDPQQFIKPAQLGPSLELGNRDNLKPAGSGPDWQDIIWWLMLAAGVVVLAVIAWRLYKQMDSPGPDG